MSRSQRSAIHVTMCALFCIAGWSCNNSNLAGLDPIIVVSPEEIDFGTVTVGIQEDRILTIQNRGGGTLTVSSVVMQDGNGPFSVETFADDIVPDGQTEVTVSFDATELGAAQDTILVSSNDPNNPVVEVPVFVNDVIGDDDDVVGDDDDSAGDDDDSAGDDDDVVEDDDDVVEDDDDDDTGDDDTGDDDTGDDDTGDDDTAPTSGDAHPDWVAAGPLTYDHTTGGGAFNDRTIGEADDVVQSIDGGNFACGDIVTFLMAVEVDGGLAANNITYEAELSFEAEPSGQPGVAYADVLQVIPNYGVVQNGDGPGGTDAGMLDDGGSTVTVIDEYFIPIGTQPFGGADELYLMFQLDDLEAGEQVIVRIDCWLICDPGSGPTGNLKADFNQARLVEADGNPVSPPVELNVGTMSIPLGSLSDVLDAEN